MAHVMDILFDIFLWTVIVLSALGLIACLFWGGE